MRIIKNHELLKLLENRMIGASDELARVQSAPNSLRNAESIGYYRGRIDAWQQLKLQLERELSGEAEAPYVTQVVPDYSRGEK